MKSKPDISVIMAVYNTTPDALIQSVKSIINQTYKNIEIIIVDDFSTLDVSNILKSLKDNRINVYRNNKNYGSAYSRNVAIKKSRGEYIAIMDSDDIALPTRLEKTHKYIINHPQYSVVGTKAIEFSDDKEYGVLGKPGVITSKDIIKGNIIIHGTALIKKTALASIGYNDNYRRAQDYVLWCNLLLNHHSLYVIDEVLYRYRVNANDYKKRTIRYRRYEIKARLTLYPKLGANLFDYYYIIRCVIAGILPANFVRFYRHQYILGKG